jgi:hypothetical protein
VTAGGFFKDQVCGFSGGYWPFAKTKAERESKHDPRLSVEERYGTIEGYVCLVEKAAARAQADRLLLPDDAARLVAEAKSSAVLPAGSVSSPEANAVARSVCGTGTR